MFYVYILKNAQNRYYIGISSKNPNIRAAEHTHNKSRWTRDKGPWRVVHFEPFTDRKEAWKRERQIKSYKGGDAFRKLLERCATACGVVPPTQILTNRKSGKSGLIGVPGD